MREESQFVAYEGGTLHVLTEGVSTREAVLALPLNLLLVKMVRVPAGEDAGAFAQPLLKAISPYPDDELTVGIETVRETEDGTIVLAAALPESACDALGEALDARKLRIVKIDALALGALGGLWSTLGDGEARRLVLMATADGISAIVVDGDVPVAIRAISSGAEMRRELMLTLLEAEDFGGSRALAEIVTVGDVPREGLEAFGPVRAVELAADAALTGVAERAAEEGTLDALPAGWRTVLEETRFKAKLIRNVAIGAGVWVLVMATLFGVPLAYGYMTDYQKGLTRSHQRAYQEVKDMKDKTEVVRKYSDHARGALEILKACSDRLPQGATLSGWTFNRDSGVSLKGESDDQNTVLNFKDALKDLGLTKDEAGETVGERVFAGGVELGQIRQSKNGKTFSIECTFEAKEEP